MLIDDDNPLWKPGTYPHDSGDGKWHDEFWCVKVVTKHPSGETEVRWLSSLRCFAGWVHRLRFASKTEARKWYWDAVLCHTPTFDERREGPQELSVSKVYLVHVKTGAKEEGAP